MSISAFIVLFACEQGQESDSSEASVRGPRIKHVCRRAAVALGNRAVFPDDMPTLSALPWEEREKILSSMGNDGEETQLTSHLACMPITALVLKFSLSLPGEYLSHPSTQDRLPVQRTAQTHNHTRVFGLWENIQALHRSSAHSVQPSSPNQVLLAVRRQGFGSNAAILHSIIKVARYPVLLKGGSISSQENGFTSAERSENYRDLSLPVAPHLVL